MQLEQCYRGFKIETIVNNDHQLETISQFRKFEEKVPQAQHETMQRALNFRKLNEHHPDENYFRNTSVFR